MTTTCQVCGRHVKTRNGVIVHHGYNEQTPPCKGSRRQPYEVARDALPQAIEKLIGEYHLTQKELSETVDTSEKQLIKGMLTSIDRDLKRLSKRFNEWKGPRNEGSV